MAFYETPRFPDAIAFGAVGGPGFSTGIVVVDSGAEYRNGAWTQARGEWDVAHAAKSAADHAELVAFFRAMRGQLHGFRFKDWADYQVAGSDGILTATGVSNEWQMYKRYTFGAVSSDRKIQKPIASTVTISGGGTYTLDATTGKVTKTAGAAPTGWTGEFDVPARFGIDQMRGEMIARGVYSWQSIPIVEIRA